MQIEEYVTVYVVDRSDAMDFCSCVWGDNGSSGWPGVPLTPKGVDMDGNYFYEFVVDVTGCGDGLILSDGAGRQFPRDNQGLNLIRDAAGRGWVVYNLDADYAASLGSDVWPEPGEVILEPGCETEGSLRCTGLKTGSAVTKTLPAGGHRFVDGECEVCRRKQKASDLYNDVKDEAWYAEPVLWASLNGVTNGTAEGVFSPNRACTRAQAVAFLWRAMSDPEP